MKVLARPRAERGTVVLVVNANERIDDTTRGSLAAERDAGVHGEPIEIAGEPGRLNVTADGAYLGVAAAGECAMVMLVADEEQVLRGAASAMGSQR